MGKTFRHKKGDDDYGWQDRKKSEFKHRRQKKLRKIVERDDRLTIKDEDIAPLQRDS